MAEREKWRAQGELASQRQLRSLQATNGGQMTEAWDLERDNRQLTHENDELRNLCCFLDDKRQKNKTAALEWQMLGKYTASVLRSEVHGFETKLGVLQEKLDGLVQENAELREMCLYLDRSRSPGEGEGGSRPSRAALATPRVGPVHIHSLCASDLAKRERSIPRYGGVTSQSTLEDRPKQPPLQAFSNTRLTVDELERRVEHLESEKLELVKSLSAAHLLAASSQENTGPTHSNFPGPVPTAHPDESLEIPPDLKSLLLGIGRGHDQTDLGSGVQGRVGGAAQRLAEGGGAEVPTEVVMKAVTCLDVCRRLEAMSVNGFPDKTEEAEAAVLKLMISIAWKRLQKELTP